MHAAIDDRPRRRGVVRGQCLAAHECILPALAAAHPGYLAQKRLQVGPDTLLAGRPGCWPVPAGTAPRWPRLQAASRQRVPWPTGRAGRGGTRRRPAALRITWHCCAARAGPPWLAQATEPGAGRDEVPRAAAAWRILCQQAVELVTAYLEGTPATAGCRFEAHLGGRPYCAEYLAQMRKTIELTRSHRARRPDPRRCRTSSSRSTGAGAPAEDG